MPSKHSKNSSDRGHATYGEKKKSSLGSVTQRLGADSQLPFGHCPLSLVAIDDAVVSPSGHIYSREAILEYLLNKTQEIKTQTKAFEEQQRHKAELQAAQQNASQIAETSKFAASQVGVGDIVERKSSSEAASHSYMESRKRHIDDTSKDIKLADLKRVSPWIVQFTPEAAPQELKEPPKRPSSPFSGQRLRSKDLIPLDLVREPALAAGKSVRYVCPVSRNTITNQRVIMLKNTRAYMLEDVYKSLALPSMQCPLTGATFKSDDVLELIPAASGFAASGPVEAKKYKPNFN